MPASCRYLGDGIFHILTLHGDNGPPTSLYACMKLMTKDSVHPLPHESPIENLLKLKKVIDSPEHQLIVFACQKYSTGGGSGNFGIKDHIKSLSNERVPIVAHASVNCLHVYAKNSRWGFSWNPISSYVYEPFAKSHSNDPDCGSTKTSVRRMLRKNLNVHIPVTPLVNHKMDNNDLFCYALTSQIVKTFCLSCLEEGEIKDFCSFIQSF